MLKLRFINCLTSMRKSLDLLGLRGELHNLQVTRVKGSMHGEGFFGGPGASGVVGPSPASASNPSLSASTATCELTTYLDSDNVTSYEEDFDLLLWWRDHKLTYPVLSIIVRDVFSIPVSIVSSESCFSMTGRILEERRRRLKPKHVEMLVCVKNWELGDRRLQHSSDCQELVEEFDNLYLDVPEDDGSGPLSASTSASASVASGPAGT
jgi:hypothetical protein